MVDDLIRVEKLIGNFCRVFGSYVSPENAPSDTAREQLQRDQNLNDEHIRELVCFSLMLRMSKRSCSLKRRQDV